MPLTTTDVRLPLRPPYASTPMRRFLAAHAAPGVEHHDPATGEHTLLVPAPSGPALVRVRLPDEHADASAAPPAVDARLVLHDAGDEVAVVARLRRWLDLDRDPADVAAALGDDPRLGPLLAARPGLRVPGSVHGLQTGLFAVLGQQVSLAAAQTFAGRLLAAFGVVPAVAVAMPAPGLRTLPDPAVLAAAGPEALQRAVGVTGARSRALHAVAAAAADGLDLDRHDDPAATRADLLALPGIGPWTADYVALRCLGDADAWLPGDLVLRRALGVRTAREAEARALGWRPYRGYALLHLWTEAVFA